MDTTINLFPESIYDRAMALGLDVTDPVVADLYLQREKSWLAPTPECQLVAPLVLTDIDIPAEGLQIDAVTRIERLTDDDLRRISEPDRFTVKTPLAYAAKWEVVVDMPPMENVGEGRSLFMRDDPVDTRAVDAVCDAIRVVSMARPGWRASSDKPKGVGRCSSLGLRYPLTYSALTRPRYKPSDNDSKHICDHHRRSYDVHRLEHGNRRFIRATPREAGSSVRSRPTSFTVVPVPPRLTTMTSYVSGLESPSRMNALS